MKNRLTGVALSVALLLVVTAAPAAATPCHGTVGEVCELVERTGQHVQEELDRVPGYVTQAQEDAAAIAFFVFCTAFPWHPACQA